MLLTTPTNYYQLPYFIQLNYNKVWENDDYAVFYSDTNMMDLESGIGKKEYSIDFPYSKSVMTGTGEFDTEGKFISAGNAGWIIVGPKLEVDSSGYYDFVLNYSMDIVDNTESRATFSIVCATENRNEEVVQTVELKEGNNHSTIKSFYINESESGIYDYRVYSTDGTVITVDSIEIYKRSDINEEK